MSNENANDILDAIDEDLMPEVGFSADFIKRVKGALIDPLNPSKGYSYSDERHTVDVFVYYPEQKDIDGTLIQKNDKMVLVDIKDMTVIVDNTFRFDDGTNVWNIANVEYVPVGDTNATLILQVRK
ncbi:MAG: hypothetical protein GY760_15995 [Deltaproteobacteria bacterium]|nr:hypothetical protein [Deltaproteobacteria bacterium]